MVNEGRCGQLLWWEICAERTSHLSSSSRVVGIYRDEYQRSIGVV